MGQEMTSRQQPWGTEGNEPSQKLRKRGSVAMPLAAFSAWQKQLVKMLGPAKVKKNFFQFGWSQGAEMAQIVSGREDLDLISQMLQGAEMHEALGQAHVRIDAKKVEIVGNEVISVLFKGSWTNSFEAEHYIKEDTAAVKPVCYMLCGFASGYISTLIGKDVFFKEHACEASGDVACQWEGKLLKDWHRDEYDSFMGTDPEEDASRFLQLEEERNRLQMVIDIHNELTEELIRSNSLKNILGILKRYISNPIIIENQKGQITDSENITLEEAAKLQASFHKRLKEWPIQKTDLFQFEHTSRLTAPIYIQNQIAGYCSFIYKQDDQPPEEIDRMILGRLTSISTLVYLNNKNIMEANARTKGILFEKMLTDGFESKEQIIRELNLLNIDASGDYHVAYLALGYSDFNEEDNLSTFTNIYEEVVQFFQERNYEVLQVQRANGILCFIPEAAEHALMQDGPTIFYERIKRSYPKIHCHVGVSSTCNDLGSVVDQMKEAMTAARFTTAHQPTMSFNELGILGILIHSQEEQAIRKIAELQLGRLYGDSEQQKDYMLTLYEFLMNGGNLELTSANLLLSVSGLRYRINRISDIANVDLRDSQKQFDLLLALKALKVIGEF
ncbi:helix-turn-helix domain-containing protein [Planococcus sp. 4-30]|uniref:helix-turn-helix domain-containing protein n=1 Tax=Planococcus sp. 4-30 TaxID=2874583 RepID=UPI001CBE4D1E|nr:helix-turn-helix domain-containing protein [Planococcus sp. 4-30]